MNDILKQRLVGALILVALGVVFWPIIFVEPGDQSSAERPSIPPRPAVATQAVEPPDMAGLRRSEEVEAQQSARAAELAWPIQAADTRLKSTPAAEPATTAEAEKPSPALAKTAGATGKKTRTEAPEELEIDSDGVPVAWILQVASVSSAEKAEALRERLLAVDQKAYVKRVKRNGRSLYRVYIGPRFERAALEAIQPRIDSEFGVESMIARYVP